MVRSLVGALAAVGEGNRPPAWPGTLAGAGPALRRDHGGAGEGTDPAGGRLPGRRLPSPSDRADCRPLRPDQAMKARLSRPHQSSTAGHGPYPVSAVSAPAPGQHGGGHLQPGAVDLADPARAVGVVVAAHQHRAVRRTANRRRSATAPDRRTASRPAPGRRPAARPAPPGPVADRRPALALALALALAWCNQSRQPSECATTSKPSSGSPASASPSPSSQPARSGRSGSAGRQCRTSRPDPVSSPASHCGQSVGRPPIGPVSRTVGTLRVGRRGMSAAYGPKITGRLTGQPARDQRNSPMSSSSCPRW